MNVLRGESIVETPARRTCADCGLPLFWTHAVFSIGPEGHKHWHGGPDGCQRAARALTRLPEVLDAAITSILDISYSTGGLICNGTEEQWADTELLQNVVVEAMAGANKAIDKIRDALAGRDR